MAENNDPKTGKPVPPTGASLTSGGLKDSSNQPRPKAPIEQGPSSKTVWKQAAQLSSQQMPAPVAQAEVTLAANHLPTENPILLSLPFHFDNSAYLTPYTHSGELSDPVSDALDRLRDRFEGLGSGPAPTISAGIGMYFAHTAHATAVDPLLPAASPWFFFIHVSPHEVSLLPQWHSKFYNLVNDEFKRFHDFPVLIRYRIVKEDDPLSAPKATPKEPLGKSIDSPKTGSPFSTPPSLNVGMEKIFGQGTRPAIISTILPALWRKSYPYHMNDHNASLMGASISIWKPDEQVPNHNYLSGTLGCFVTLEDSNGETLKRGDDKLRPRIFAVTCGHVLSKKGDRETYDVAACAKGGPRFVAAHLSMGDRLETFLSRKRRMLAYQKRIAELDTIIANKPDTNGNADDLHAWHWACSLRRSIVDRVNLDVMDGRSALEESTIGKVFLISGLRNVYVPAKAMEPLEGPELPYVVDYGLVEMYSLPSHRCANVLSPSFYPCPQDHPQSMDIMRAHMSARGLGKAGQNGPAEDVMKAGRTTGVTFGTANAERISHLRTNNNKRETFEVSVFPRTAVAKSIFGTVGDSGSAVINGDGEIIGILCAGIDKTDAEGQKLQGSVAILPMQVLQYDLKKTFGYTMRFHQLPEQDTDHFQPTASQPDPAMMDSRFEEIPAGQNAKVHDMFAKDGELRFQISSSTIAKPEWFDAVHLNAEWEPIIQTYITDNMASTVAKRQQQIPSRPRLKAEFDDRPIALPNLGKN